MAKSMIAPMVATMMDQMFNPVTPVPPKRLNTKPPTKAPAIPMRIVTIMPPGSSPGMISFASNPASSPTKIQLRRPTFFSTLLFSRVIHASYNKYRPHRRDPGHAVRARGTGIECPSAGGRSLDRRGVVHRPAARELSRAPHAVACRRIDGVLDLPPLGPDEVLLEGPRRPRHLRRHSPVPPVSGLAIAPALQEVAVYGGDISLPRPLDHDLPTFPARARDL